MKKNIRFIAIPVILLSIGYLSGPHPDTPVFSFVMPVIPTETSALEQYISLNEAKHKIKPDNEARIVWADSLKQKTPYSIVYLH